MADPIAGYHADASRLAERYESVASQMVHGVIADLVVRGEQRLALDVGAGSGRDAAWLASLGYEVVAVEPAAGLRQEAKQRHPEATIRWLDDRLPELGVVHRLGLAFDLILLSGVWMHIRPTERARAFRKLVTLLKPGGLLLLSIRNASQDPNRPMWETSAGEIESLARDHGLAVVRIAAGADLLGREDVHWTTIVLRLADDGSGALPLLRGVILNDDKSSTYKLGLIRAIAKVADATPALARPHPEDDTVDIPLTLVALNWLRMYLPLVTAGLPQLPGNSGPVGLGFAKTGFRELAALAVAGQDLRVGARFTGERALALSRALSEARRTICDMPVRYTRLPNAASQVFTAAKSGVFRASADLTLDAATLEAGGWLTVPGHVWRTLQRLGAWVEPVLVSEWDRLIRSYAERMGHSVSAQETETALRWLDPARDTLLARNVAQRLLDSGQVVACAWTARALSARDLDIDHCLPWSAWPCGDLWNLLPAARRVNQHMKRDRLPSAAALAAARPQILTWWTSAWDADPALGSRFHREAAAALAVTPSASPDQLFAGLEWRRLRLSQDQQVQEWAGAHSLTEA